MTPRLGKGPSQRTTSDPVGFFGLPIEARNDFYKRVQSARRVTSLLSFFKTQHVQSSLSFASEKTLSMAGIVIHQSTNIQ